MFIPSSAGAVEAGGGDFTLSAGADTPSIGDIGYISTSGSGSVSGDTSADGGTVNALYWDTSAGYHRLDIAGGSAGASSIEIDATSYALSLLVDGATDIYTFENTSSVFTAGVDYEVSIT